MFPVERVEVVIKQPVCRGAVIKKWKALNSRQEPLGPLLKSNNMKESPLKANILLENLIPACTAVRCQTFTCFVLHIYIKV